MMCVCSGVSLTLVVSKSNLPHKTHFVHAGAVRLYVVLDTSVLLSHWSFIQALHRNLGQDGAVRPEQASSPAPAVQLLLVVPWAVLVELDKLKEERSVLRIQGTCICMCPAPNVATLMTCHHFL